MTTYLGREQILAASDLKTEAIDVPEWGGQVLVSTLTSADADAWEGWAALNTGGDGKFQSGFYERLRARFVAMCVVDDQGARVFSDVDVDELAKKSSAAIKRVFEKAQELNGYTDEDLEEIAGN